MDNVKVFKKFEVIGNTKDEAINNAAPMNLRVDATQSYNKWAEQNSTNEDDVKEWMKQYLAKKKFTAINDGAYIVLQSAKVDSRQRPYKETKIKHEARTHTPMKVYAIRRNDTNERIGVEKTYKAAAQVAKKYVTENHVSLAVFVEADFKEKNAKYATFDYTPSSGTQPCKLLVFGYKAVE